MNNKILEINNLTKIYKTNSIKAIDDISLKMYKGDILSIIGPNGSGKTTLFKILLNIYDYNMGSYSIFSSYDYEKISHKIAYLPDIPDYNENFKAFEYLNYFSKFYSNKNKNESDKIHNLIDFVGLSEHKNKKIKNYSRGMKQRLGLARTLISNPELIILDEPLSYLDPLGKMEFIKLIKDINNKGISIIISSHDLDDIEKLATRVIILDKGKKLLDDKIINILQDRNFAERAF